VGVVTEKTAGGVRLRIVVSEASWQRIQEMSKTLLVEERELVHVCLALGVRYFDLITNPVTAGAAAQLAERFEREGDAIIDELAGAGAQT
jgi:ribosome biogenesis protein Tsr3